MSPLCLPSPFYALMTLPYSNPTLSKPAPLTWHRPPPPPPSRQPMELHLRSKRDMLQQMLGPHSEADLDLFLGCPRHQLCRCKGGLFCGLSCSLSIATEPRRKRPAKPLTSPLLRDYHGRLDEALRSRNKQNQSMVCTVQYLKDGVETPRGLVGSSVLDDEQTNCRKKLSGEVLVAISRDRAMLCIPITSILTVYHTTEVH